MRKLFLLVIRYLLPLVLVVGAGDAMALQHRDDGPLRLWGEISSTYRVVQPGGADAGRSTNLRNTGTISASTYLWRPWFALLNGSLSLSTDETESDDQFNAEDQFVTGDLDFNLFPTSRFPFSAYYRESRNEFDNSNLTRNVDTVEYGLTQRYRTPDGRHRYRGEYENNHQDRGEGVVFDTENFLLAASNRIGRHSLNTDISFDAVDNRGTGESLDSQTLTLDHAWDGVPNLTLDNLASHTVSESDLIGARNDIEISQFSSFATWQPRDRRDLRLTGSVRLIETTLVDEVLTTSPASRSEHEIESVNLNQGLIWDATDQLQFSESVNANRTTNDGEELFIASESIAASYSSLRAETRLGDYGWFVSSSYTNLHGDLEREELLEAQFSHSLMNDYSNAGAYRLTGNVTQSLSYQDRSVGDDENRLGHSYSLTWSDAAAGGRNLVRFYASDSRQLNEEEDYFQLLNLQYTGSSQRDRYAYFDGNVTLQLTRQRSDGDESEETLTNGYIKYRRDRLFRVIGLTFSSELQLNQRRSETERFLQDFDEDTGVTWENTLLYRVGRLETELEIDFVKVGDEYDRLFKFRLNRTFGDL